MPRVYTLVPIVFAWLVVSPVASCLWFLRTGAGRLWDSGLCVTGYVSPLLIQTLSRLNVVALATP
ncbi:hypothetical protein HMPREF1255_0503 [Propionimicrobium sp. BV2F7]|nr:hypothetical protein HMPREF1255_0503 [Propionimicrobium sp. BV2F7]